MKFKIQNLQEKIPITSNDIEIFTRDVETLNTQQIETLKNIRTMSVTKKLLLDAGVNMTIQSLGHEALKIVEIKISDKQRLAKVFKSVVTKLKTCKRFRFSFIDNIEAFDTNTLDVDLEDLES